MKKSLLALSFALASSAAIAQTSTPGIHPTYVFDNFVDTDPTTEGVQEYYDTESEVGMFYYSGDADEDTVKAPVRAGDGLLKIEVTNGGSYQNLFGVTFGDDKTINVSENADIRLKIKNDGATAGDTLLIQMQLRSDNGKGEFEPFSVVKINDEDPGWSSPDRKKKIEFFVLSGETKEVYLDLTPNGAGTGTGGYAADNYSCSSPATCPVTAYTLDAAALKEILFFINPIVTLAESEKTDYAPLGVYDGTIEISALSIGTELPFPTGNRNKVADVSNLVIQPNPASELATVTYNAKSSDVVVNVSDLKGNVVKTVNGSSSSAKIETAGLTAGLYVVSVLVDGIPSAPQKLVVK